MSNDFTSQERADLRLAAPELADMTRHELQQLAARYPTDERIRALAEGRPTPGARSEAAQEDPTRKASLRARYPSMFPTG